jgi:transposase
MKNNATVIGMDIAKNVFFVVGKDERGHEVLKRKMSRNQVLVFFANHPVANVGIEACATAHYWARELIKLGHDTKLIAGQHVSRRVVGNKNDYRDAKAICDLRSEPATLHVPLNTETQQDMQMVHRIRQRLVSHRKALMSQVRGLLGEYGLSFPAGVKPLREGLKAVLGGKHHGLSCEALGLFAELQTQLTELDRWVNEYDDRIQALSRHKEAERLMKIPGFGPLNATAFIAAVGDAHHFPSGRSLAANTA